MSADVTEASGSGPSHRRKSSIAAPGILSAAEFEANEALEYLTLPKDAGKINWKINTSSSTAPDPDMLKKLLTTPPVKKVDLQFPTGITVTARNLKGVTIKDALDAIHKQFKKRADDELSEPYLAGFYHDEDEKGKCILRVALGKEGAPINKKKKKGGADE